MRQESRVSSPGLASAAQPRPNPGKNSATLKAGRWGRTAKGLLRAVGRESHAARAEALAMLLPHGMDVAQPSEHRRRQADALSARHRAPRSGPRVKSIGTI